MSWLASNPLIPSVIAGATTKAQIQANANAVSWQLTAQQREEINTLVDIKH